MVLGQQTCEPLARDDTAIEEAGCAPLGLRADHNRRTPGRRKVIRLLECIRSTDHRDDTICDFIAGVHHEVRPQVFLDRPLRRGLAGTGVHIRTVREADPTCDDFFNKTPSIRPAGRVWARRTARRPFDFSFQSKAATLVNDAALVNERCSPCDEGAIDTRVDDDLHGHSMISVQLYPRVTFLTAHHKSIGWLEGT